MLDLTAEFNIVAYNLWIYCLADMGVLEAAYHYSPSLETEVAFGDRELIRYLLVVGFPQGAILSLMLLNTYMLPIWVIRNGQASNRSPGDRRAAVSNSMMPLPGKPNVMPPYKSLDSLVKSPVFLVIPRKD